MLLKPSTNFCLASSFPFRVCSFFLLALRIDSRRCEWGSFSSFCPFSSCLATRCIFNFWELNERLSLKLIWIEFVDSIRCFYFFFTTHARMCVLWVFIWNCSCCSEQLVRNANEQAISFDWNQIIWKMCSCSRCITDRRSICLSIAEKSAEAETIYFNVISV